MGDPFLPKLGPIISHFKITEKLGQGGMGVAYKGECTLPDWM